MNPESVLAGGQIPLTLKSIPCQAQLSQEYFNVRFSHFLP